MAFLQTLFFVTRQILRYVPSSRALLVLLTLTTTTTLFLSHYPKLVPLTVTRYLNKIRGKPEIDWYTTRFLDERLPIRPKPQVVKWNIVACAMVHNEAAYLAEWIEFHRLQGVDHFVLYDYRSTDLLVYYPMFYEDVGQKDLIDIIPAKFVPREMRDEKNHKKDRRLNKHYAMIDCYMRHRNLTQWIVMMEVSQFLYTPAHNSTWNFVKDLQIEHRQNLSVIATSSMTYGPVPDITTTFDSWMTPNSRTGGVDFNYQPVNGTFDVFPLVTDANPRRASHQELDASFEPCHGDKENCSPISPPVVFVRATRCKVNNVTECIFNAPGSKMVPVPDGSVTPNAKDFHVKNYPWRPRNLSPPHDSLPVVLANLSAVPTWFSSVADESAPAQADVIRKRIMAMKPTIFWNVARDCLPEALKTGQQVKCPPSHPYPYGEVGVNYLRDCCAVDKDEQGVALRVNSTSCWQGNKVPCRDPVHLKTPWLHRSCCVNTGRN